MPAPTSWSEGQIDRLKTLWNDGFSASQIAEALGFVSRSAVLSKVHRLQLPTRLKPQAERQIRVRDHRAEHLRRLELRSSAPRPPRDFMKRADKIDVPPSENLTISDPRFFRRCRFITSETNAPEALYCGHEVISGAWCPAHHQIVYVPAEARQQRRAA